MRASLKIGRRASGVFSNFIGFVAVGGDPPKSPLKRGTLSRFSPLFKGGMGGIWGLKTRPRGWGLGE
jgi:hypothetical protein